MKFRIGYWLLYPWALPATLIGLILAVVVYRAHSWRWNDGCLECGRVLAVLLVFGLAGSCRCPQKPPVYLPPAAALDKEPPKRPVIEPVDCQHSEVYRCFTRDGTWELVSYLNAIRVYAEEAWTKCGRHEEVAPEDKAVDP